MLFITLNKFTFIHNLNRKSTKRKKKKEKRKQQGALSFNFDEGLEEEEDLEENKSIMFYITVI